MAEVRAASPQRKSKTKASSPVTETETLNFKVTSEFKREYKGYAVSEGMTMLDLVNDAPELSNVVCLQKPFRPADLVLAVEVATRRRSSGTGGVKVIAAITP